MGWFEIVGEVLVIGLRLWDRHDKNKYFEEYRKLERTRSNEESKPIETRDQALLDYTDRELLLLSKKFISHTKNGGPDSPFKS